MENLQTIHIHILGLKEFFKQIYKKYQWNGNIFPSHKEQLPLLL